MRSVSTPKARDAFSLPQESWLECGPRLRQTGTELPGIHTPYAYVSMTRGTAAALHIEDAGLGSINILLAGAPKLWLVIYPEHQKKLEARIRETFSNIMTLHNCSQFVRHLNILLSPRLLDTWDISYTTFEQNHTNRIVGTLPGAYHQVINSGCNLAEAINFAVEHDWSVPEDYTFCNNRCAPHPITADDLTIAENPKATVPDGSSSTDAQDPNSSALFCTPDKERSSAFDRAKPDQSPTHTIPSSVFRGTSSLTPNSQTYLESSNDTASTPATSVGDADDARPDVGDASHVPVKTDGEQDSTMEDRIPTNAPPADEVRSEHDVIVEEASLSPIELVTPFTPTITDAPRTSISTAGQTEAKQDPRATTSPAAEHKDGQSATESTLLTPLSPKVNAAQSSSSAGVSQLKQLTVRSTTAHDRGQGEHASAPYEISDSPVDVPFINAWSLPVSPTVLREDQGKSAIESLIEYAAKCGPSRFRLPFDGSCTQF